MPVGEDVGGLVFVTLGETARIDFRLGRVVAQLEAVQVTALGDEQGTVTGATTVIDL